MKKENKHSYILIVKNTKNKIFSIHSADVEQGYSLKISKNQGLGLSCEKTDNFNAEQLLIDSRWCKVKDALNETLYGKDADNASIGYANIP